MNIHFCDTTPSVVISSLFTITWKSRNVHLHWYHKLHLVTSCRHGSVWRNILQIECIKCSKYFSRCLDRKWPPAPASWCMHDTETPSDSGMLAWFVCDTCLLGTKLDTLSATLCTDSTWVCERACFPIICILLLTGTRWWRADTDVYFWDNGRCQRYYCKQNCDQCLHSHCLTIHWSVCTCRTWTIKYAVYFWR